MLSTRLRRALGPVLHLDARSKWKSYATVGDEIGRVISRAVHDLKKQRARVAYFRFNGTRVVVHRGDNPSMVRAKWLRDMDARSAAYRKSRRYKRMIVMRAREAAENQAKMDELVASVKYLPVGHHETLAMLAKFGDLADRGATFNGEYMTGFLHARGYVGGAHVGRDKDTFTDPDVMAEYIVGQALTMLAVDGPSPWHLVSMFCDRFAALPAVAA